MQYPSHLCALYSITVRCIYVSVDICSLVLCNIFVPGFRCKNVDLQFATGTQRVLNVLRTHDKCTFSQTYLPPYMSCNSHMAGTEKL